MLSADSLAAFQKLVSQRERFLVVSHVRPDGRRLRLDPRPGADLRALGKDVVVFNSDGLSPLYAFLPGSADFTQLAPGTLEADRCVIAVDCADAKRLGPGFDAWQRTPDVNIDHHVSNPGYAALNLVDADSPATAQVLFEIIAPLNWPLTKAAAENLYVGIMTDTGGFRYRQTTARTFEIAGKLVAAGADPTDLAESCYQSFRAERLLLIAEVFKAMRFTDRNRIAWFVLTPEMYTLSGAIPDETEGADRVPAIGEDGRVRLPDRVAARGPDARQHAFARQSRRAADLQGIRRWRPSPRRGPAHEAHPAELEKRLLDLIAKQLPE